MSENLCDSCVGACCRADTVVLLTKKEVKFLRRGNTNVVGYLSLVFPDLAAAWSDYEKLHDLLKDNMQTEPERWMSPEHQLLRSRIMRESDNRHRTYILESDCGYLDTEQTPPRCTAYDDPEKPAICGDFTPGNRNCLTMRQTHGVPVELTPKPSEE